MIKLTESNFDKFIADFNNDFEFTGIVGDWDLTAENSTIWSNHNGDHLEPDDLRLILEKCTDKKISESQLLKLLDKHQEECIFDYSRHLVQAPYGWERGVTVAHINKLNEAWAESEEPEEAEKPALFTVNKTITQTGSNKGLSLLNDIAGVSEH